MTDEGAASRRSSGSGWTVLTGSASTSRVGKRLSLDTAPPGPNSYAMRPSPAASTDYRGSASTGPARRSASESWTVISPGDEGGDVQVCTISATLRRPTWNLTKRHKEAVTSLITSVTTASPSTDVSWRTPAFAFAAPDSHGWLVTETGRLINEESALSWDGATDLYDLLQRTMRDCGADAGLADVDFLTAAAHPRGASLRRGARRRIVLLRRSRGRR
jgi:hypothetical protein